MNKISGEADSVLRKVGDPEFQLLLCLTVLQLPMRVIMPV